MQDKPSRREDPHHLIIPVGTNYISTNKQSEQIAKSTIESALSVKSKFFDVTLSHISQKWWSQTSQFGRITHREILMIIVFRIPLF